MDNYQSLSDPILIKESVADSRSLIMPHQQEAVDELNHYFNLLSDKAREQNGLVVMPTGSGKTFTAVNWLLTAGIANGYRIIWLAHRQELIDQTNNEFRKQVPILANTGIKKIRILPISGMKEHFKMSEASRADIYVCSIASVANKYGYRFIRRMLGEAGKRKLIVVIDEAHHAVSAQYQKVLKRITEINPNRLLLGLTATPTRMQEQDLKKLFQMFNVKLNLQKGMGDAKGFIYEITLKQLLISGFLAKPIREKVNTEIVGEVEYSFTPEDEVYFNTFAELSEKVMNQIGKSSARNKVIVDQYINNKDRYGKTIIFAVNQMHAKTLCDEFKERGISCDYVVSGKAGAQQTISDFKKNKFEVLINVQILTEGSDVPDIKTVFLTRETNSDALLMQMIGRGLRGEKAGGTEIAYIVDFHDTWDKYKFWLDPGKLDIFTDTEDGKKEDQNENGNKLDEQSEKEICDELKQEVDVNLHDFYMKLYSLIRVSFQTQTEKLRMPCGWYSVVNENGDNIRILVYEEQLSSYARIDNHKQRLISKRPSADIVIKMFFDDCQEKPDEREMDELLDFLYETSEMPEYYTFELRRVVEPKVIADKMNKLFEKEEEKEAWLKELFDNSPIIREIYKFFYAFKKTIYNAMKEEKDSVIQSVDEREQYSIVKDVYDVEELCKEVLQQYPELNDRGLMEIIWSPVVVKSWFGFCERYSYPDKEPDYRIQINCLLSSPQVDKEVIKYLIYHELLHLNGLWDHDAIFREKEWAYPNSDELDGFLDELALRYNLDVPLSNAKYTFIGESPTEYKEPEKKQEPAAVNEFNDKADGIIKGFKYCRNCGNRLPSDAKFCDKCGTRADY